MTTTEWITALSAAVAALSFLWGISAWRHEFIGKRRIELAETILALFYEAEDAIKSIRSPFAFGDEGSTRQKSEYETKEETSKLNNAYVAYERYKKREKLFAELRSMKYRAMATFGPQSGEPFNALSKILNEIFTAGQILGTHYWRGSTRPPLDTDAFRKYVEEMNKYQAIFWMMGEGDDAISLRVRRAVEQIEEITKEAAFA